MKVEEEAANSLGPQVIAMLGSITAGLSTIVATQLKKRFRLSFHSTTPRWKYVIFPSLIYALPMWASSRTV